MMRRVARPRRRPRPRRCVKPSCGASPRRAPVAAKREAPLTRLVSELMHVRHAKVGRGRGSDRRRALGHDPARIGAARPWIVPSRRPLPRSLRAARPRLRSRGDPREPRGYGPACRSCRTRRTGPGCSSEVCPECGFDTARRRPGRAGQPHRPHHRRVAGDPRAARRARAAERRAPGPRSSTRATCATSTGSTPGGWGGCSTRTTRTTTTGTRTPRPIEERYAEQDPATVAAELAAAGATLGDLFAGVDGDGWERTGRRSDGASFTVDSIGRYYLHDIEHHIWDVTGALPSG